MPTLDTLTQTLAQAGIRLIIQPKRIKHINFRLKLGEWHVSTPHHISQAALIAAIASRYSWAIDKHTKLMAQAQQTPAIPTLWGEPTHFDNDQICLAHYRQAIQNEIPRLCQTWQPIVGKTAHEVRIKKMYTRWGVCNIAKGRIWLSLYLAAYPKPCLDYVFVHELCHLHHANHSPAFWQTVKNAMPDYQTWHKQLKDSSIKPHWLIKP